MQTQQVEDNTNWDAIMEEHRSQELGERRQHFRRRIIQWCACLCFVVIFVCYWINRPLASSRQGSYTVLVKKVGVDHICEAWSGNQLYGSEVIASSDSFVYPDSATIKWTGANTFAVTLHFGKELYPPDPVLSGDFRKPKSKALRLLR